MKSTSNYMNPEEMEKVIDAIPLLHIRKWSDESVQWMFRIAYYCALRLGEAVKLSVEDFDFDRREVFLGKTKTKRNDSRVIPIDFVEPLQDYLIGKSGPLTPGLTVGTVRPWIIKLGVLLDIPAWITPQSETGEKTKCHIFRKSRGKDLHVIKKVPLSVIMNMYGHADLGTTSKYLRANNENVKEFI